MNVTIKREIRCEYCREYREIDAYGDVDLSDLDSLFSPVHCPDCDRGFMAMDFTPRIYVR